MHMHTHLNGRRLIRMHAHLLTHTHNLGTQACIHAHMHACTHARAHTRTLHMYARTDIIRSGFRLRPWPESSLAPASATVYTSVDVQHCSSAAVQQRSSATVQHQRNSAQAFAAAWAVVAYSERRITQNIYWYYCSTRARAI